MKTNSLKSCFSAALIMGLINWPVSLMLPHKAVETKTESAKTESALSIGSVTSTINELFFGSDAYITELKSIITKQINFVRTRPAYAASLAVVEKNEEAIREVAREKNVPEDVALGVAFLENGGSETAKSSAGAMGIYQLMPGTARNLGLTVNKTVDERKNPEKSIEAGISYLAHNYELFGDWGLATWAYHAGEGNVGKALKIYKEANDTSKQPNVHDLLSDPAVQKFTKKLNDDSAGYPYKVIATATLFQDAGNPLSIR